MTQALVALDTDRIKDYVFATGKLAEIRGASALLDYLNREEMPCLVRGEKIYAHGGSGLFVVPSNQAETSIQSVQKHYQEATESATVTGAKIELPSNFEEESNLRPYWRRLSLQLRAAKERNASPTSIVTHSFLRPCVSCGSYHAANTYFEADAVRPVLLCQSCYIKHREDQQIKGEIPKLVRGELPPRPNRLWHRLVSELQQANYSFKGLSRPEDFDALGKQSSPKDYLGLIYADGDDMGRNLEGIPSLKEMRRFARAVDEGIYGAVKHAILGHLQPEPGANSLPFDVLLLGGDDLVIVTTAHTAVEVALTVMEQFPALTEEYCGQRLSLSVAVIWAHIKFPLGSLVELAESTLKFAKKERAKRRLTEGLLNFLVVSSPNHLDFGDYYKSTLKEEHLNETLYRTMRPYTMREMHRLVQAKRDLATASRGKLEQLRSALFKRRHQAMLEGLITLLRWRDVEQQQHIRQLMSDFAADQTELFPWIRRNSHTYHTPLLDLVELFDFIP